MVYEEGECEMAVCRNCKKQVDANATVCPYCHTHMPGNDFLANCQTVMIGIFVLGFALFAIIYGIISIFT